MSLGFQGLLFYKDTKKETAITRCLASCRQVSVLPGKQTSLIFACKLHGVWIIIMYIVAVLLKERHCVKSTEVFFLKC